MSPAPWSGAKTAAPPAIRPTMTRVLMSSLLPFGGQGEEPGAGAYNSQLIDGIGAPSLHPHERQPDLKEHRIDEGVSLLALGQEVALVVDLDRGDRIEGQDVADHEIDALRHDAVQRLASGGGVCAKRGAGKLGKAHLSEGAVVLAKRGVERHQEGLFIGGQESATLIAGAATAWTTDHEDDEC